MTQKEFSKQVKALQKELDESLILTMQHKRSFEEHMKIHKKWRDLYKFAKDNNLYMQ